VQASRSRRFHPCSDARQSLANFESNRLHLFASSKGDRASSFAMFARQACDNEFSTLIWHLSTVAKLQSAGVSVTASLIRGADEYAIDRRRGAQQQSTR
jgi:ABC-type transporter Mla MlaB component